MSIDTAFDETTDFRISNIEYEKDAPFSVPEEITFANAADGGKSNRYARPSISIDNKGRFVTHEIIGGTTVRQKIGEEPREASIDGVCVEQTARELDTLRDAKRATIFCDRFPGGSMTVHITAVSTSPFDDGGAANITQGELLYSWSMKVVEINTFGDGSVSAGSGTDSGGGINPSNENLRDE